MPTQTYVESGSTSTPTLVVPGADADSVSGVYQVFVSLIHAWGDPVFNHSRLTDSVLADDTSIVVHDGTQFAVNDYITFLDGNQESVRISAISTNTLTVSALAFPHNKNVRVSKEAVATRASANNYSYAFTANNLKASGKHKVHWRYVQSSVSTFSDSFITVYRQYIDSTSFFALYPELSSEFNSSFIGQERKVRKIIDTFCGQDFEYYPSKTLIFDGSGKNTLHVIERLERFSTAYLRDDYSDITTLIEKDPSSDYYLRLTDSFAAPVPQTKQTSSSKATWGNSSQFEIIGDWGWESVPVNITEAAAILIADRFNEDSALTRHGVINTVMDTHVLKFDSTILGTTGNLDADTLLMDYTLFVLGEI